MQQRPLLLSIFLVFELSQAQTHQSDISHLTMNTDVSVKISIDVSESMEDVLVKSEVGDPCHNFSYNDNFFGVFSPSDIPVRLRFDESVPA